MLNFFAQLDPTALQEQITEANNQQAQLLEFAQTMQGFLKAYLPFLIAGVAVFAFLFLINAINKMRVDRAIIRMDKNIAKILEKLPDRMLAHEPKSYANMYEPKPPPDDSPPPAEQEQPKTTDQQ